MSRVLHAIKHIKSSCGLGSSTSTTDSQNPPLNESTRPSSSIEDETLEEPEPLRPLTSLKWPYVPEESAYPDPLARDDPKPLQLRHYEAIATSPAIRQVLTSHPNLPDILTSIDQLRGIDRDRALQRALGVTAPEIVDQSKGAQVEQDVLAVRAFAEAVEAVVRADKQDVLGLDWDG
ncbi:hypothetical protein K435DRAFT_790202 [Dendrothele bispora CBS 962.96]|uniref:Uncharacterized protein n=1 Tax=Dendrothele bispora (strain CBS 962.96) TaxID=1314807 RepID=A0A4S8MSQ1_DENBC|nr:hypothetical protein K435DRAFT_790202 [Dendrothele bispora CBS 962.96]